MASSRSCWRRDEFERRIQKLGPVSRDAVRRETDSGFIFEFSCLCIRTAPRYIEPPPFGSCALRPFFFNRMANECFQQLPAPRGLGPSEERFATYIAPRRLRGCRRADRCRCRRQRTGSRHWRRLLSSTAYGRLIQINYLRRRRVECSIRQGRTSLIREKCNDPVDSCGGGLGVGIISSGRSPCASSSAG